MANGLKSMRIRLVPAFLAGALFAGSLIIAGSKLNVLATSSTQSQTGTQSVIDISGSGTKNVSMSGTGSSSYAAIDQAAAPAVVRIESLAKSGRNNRSMTGSEEAIGTGSGFLFDSSGYILTNEHVIHGADSVQVTVQGHDTPFAAKIVESRYDQDLAVLKISGDSKFPALSIAGSDASEIGQSVIAIGNPYDLGFSLTSGVLSAIDREISIDDADGTRDYKHLIQTDTAINPGNSGGPLLNTNGEVIGMNTAISADAERIGFAIPVSTIRSMLNDIKAKISS